MRVKWACPAGMWGLRRHSCQCSMRGGPCWGFSNWSLPTSDTLQTLCLLFRKHWALFVSRWAASVSRNISGTTWKLRYYFFQEESCTVVGGYMVIRKSCRLVTSLFLFLVWILGRTLKITMMYLCDRCVCNKITKPFRSEATALCAKF